MCRNDACPVCDEFIVWAHHDTIGGHATNALQLLDVGTAHPVVELLLSLRRRLRAIAFLADITGDGWTAEDAAQLAAEIRESDHADADPLAFDGQQHEPVSCTVTHVPGVRCTWCGQVDP